MRQIAVLLSLALASAAQAGAIVKITSTEASRVAISGEELGLTPVVIRDLKPGKYEVRVENMKTGQVQTYLVNSPKAGTVERELNVTWASSPPATVVQPVAVVPVAAPQAAIVPVHAAPPAELPEDAPEDPNAAVKAKERSRVRTRNVVLGATLANEVFNKGKSKKTLRKVGIGGALLNEALNR
jgi:hypothetical protein